MTNAPHERVMFRATRANPPTLYDFLSNIERRRRLPPNATAEVQRRWAGLSMYDERSALEDVVRATPAVGSFIAEVRIAGAMQVTISQFGVNPHHFTVWGNPAELLAAVTSVARVR